MPSRGVVKIAEASTESKEELDCHLVREIVADVFQRKGLTAPYSIEFELKPSMNSKPQAYFKDEKLHIIASTESELRRLIGRLIIERSWSRHEWFLTNHVGLYTLTSMILVTTLPAISFSMAFLVQELRIGLVAFTVAGVVMFCIWSGHKVSIKSIRLLRKLTLEMVELGCMTEYDGKDYEGDPHKAAVAGIAICMWGGLVNGIYGLAFSTLAMPIFLFSLIPPVLAGVYYMFSAVSRFIDLNLCYENEAYDEELMDEEEYDSWAEYEENEYLQAEFTDLIERMNLRGSLISRHESGFNGIKVGYSETKYTHCRWAYDFVEEETLYIYCRDISEAAARHYGTGILVKETLRFYSELSGKRRAIYLIAFFFGLIMLMPILLGAYMVSREFAISCLFFTGIVYFIMWWIGKMQNDEARRELSDRLKQTGVFNDYEFEFYKKEMFSISPRFDWAFLIGYLSVLLGVAFLILLLV